MVFPAQYSGLTGTVRKFGPLGPSYIIGELSRPSSNGDWYVSVTVPETGEIFDYELSKIVADPVGA